MWKVCGTLADMRERTADTNPGQPDTNPGQPDSRTAAPARRRGADTLRYIPPVAALGTAFVLQVILITDTVGSALADRQADSDWRWFAFVVAGLLGLSVASCVEGGAAYLLHLYDKHLLAGDSVWLLRLAMVVYVTGSAAAVHWWTGHRGLPEVVSWLLAGMSASALFLWSRGSRWQQREEMRAAGQLDRAMPRLSVAAKVWHPWRWLVTTYLVSWEPVRTTDEARVRYEQWRTRPHWWRRKGRTADSPLPVRKEANTPQAVRNETNTPQAGQVSDADHKVVPFTSSPVRRPRTRTAASPAADMPTVEQLADTLSAKHPGQYVGTPTAVNTLRQVYGSCSKDRAIAAKDIHNARRDRTGTGQAGEDDDKERSVVEVSA